MQEIQRRLKPGAPLVVAHLNFPQSETERALWLSCYAAFAVVSGVEPDKAEFARAKIAAELPIFAPAQEEAILREAGFSDVSLFYVGFSWVGGVRQAFVTGRPRLDGAGLLTPRITAQSGRAAPEHGSNYRPQGLTGAVE